MHDSKLKTALRAGAVAVVALCASGPVLAQSAAQLDLNDDLIVNVRDALVLRACYNAPAACNPEADFNGDGVINAGDYQILRAHYGTVVPAAEVTVTGDSVVTVPLGQSVNVVYTVTLDAQAPGTYEIQYAESAAPAGLGVVNDAFDAFPAFPGDSTVQLINETLTGEALGEYILTKTVQLVDPAGSSELTVVVNVVDTTDTPVLKAPGSEPPGIPVDEATAVIFSVQLAGTSLTPDSVEVRKVGPLGEDLGLLATLGDAGEDVDAVAGDGVYTGINTVLGTTAGIISYKVLASFPGGGSAESPIAQLTVTDLLIGLPAFDTTVTGTEIDPATNSEVVSGMVMGFLSEGTTPEAAGAALALAGFGLLGYDPALNTMAASTPIGLDLAQSVALLASLPEFSDAEPNGVDVLSEFAPNDQSYGSQYGFPRTRADEAWVISRGQGVLVGMLDTGADLDHPDLQANLWKLNVTVDLPIIGTVTLLNRLGFDMVDGDDIPEDANGHGTHVAGTIAAVTNNSTQVAGMAPSAKVMVIRTLGPGGGSHSQFASGVRKAADMGVKVISYSGGGSDSTTKQNAVNYAVGKGVLFIAAAGNDNTSSTTSAFPAAYANVMAIGSTTTTDGRSTFSNFGNWVSMAAPGTNILSTWLAGGTNTISGTSMATPHVSGAAALVWSAHPTLSAAAVQQRLERTALPLAASLQLGAGRLDAFGAVFNPSFETGNLTGWTTAGTAASVTALGPLVPQDRARMGYVSTGPADTNIATTLSQGFTVQNDVASIPVEFRYNFVTEEFPEWVGTEFNDCTLIQLQTPGGTVHTLAAESVNGSPMTAIGGINLPGGDDTVGQTGWKTARISVPTTQGPGEYRIFVTDAGDDIFDTVVLIDDIRFKASGATSGPVPTPTCPDPTSGGGAS